MKPQDKEKIKKIRADIKASSIPEELKVLYLLANAVEIISQQSLLRLKSVYARHGYKIKDNDMLTGPNTIVSSDSPAVTCIASSRIPLKELSVMPLSRPLNVDLSCIIDCFIK